MTCGRSLALGAAVMTGLLLALGLAPAACTRARRAAAPVKIRIGSLPAEDSLPLYVAIQDGLLEGTGIDLRMVGLASARERDEALKAGRIDGFVAHVPGAAISGAHAVPVRVVSVMLGAEPDEGRFGIAVPKGSPIKQPIQLRRVPIAVSSDPVTSYVADALLTAEGLAADEIKTLEVGSPSEEARALLAGRVRAAVLPDPLLSHVQDKGARVIIDDAAGANLSQSVLALTKAFTDRHPAAVKGLLVAQGRAVAAIGADPDRYLGLLARRARLPRGMSRTYQLNAYPAPQLPKRDDVEPVLEWLVGKGLISSGLTYQALVSWGASTGGSG